MTEPQHAASPPWPARHRRTRGAGRSPAAAARRSCSTPGPRPAPGLTQRLGAPPSPHPKNGQPVKSWRDSLTGESSTDTLLAGRTNGGGPSNREGTMKKGTGSMLAASLLIAVGASPASAEAFFESSISGAQKGFLSRIWYDNNYDNVDTKIGFGGCDRANLKVGVYRQVLGIDPNLGTKTLCSNRTGNWGDMRRAEYRFKLMEGRDVDVDYVYVQW